MQSNADRLKLQDRTIAKLYHCLDENQRILANQRAMEVYVSIRVPNPDMWETIICMAETQVLEEMRDEVRAGLRYA